MKELYDELEAEVIHFEAADIITGSNDSPELDLSSQQGDGVSIF